MCNICKGIHSQEKTPKGPVQLEPRTPGLCQFLNELKLLHKLLHLTKVFIFLRIVKLLLCTERNVHF